MADFFTDVWKSIVGFLGSFNWIVDTLDILLVAFIIYSAIKLVRDSRAEQLLKGIILLLVMFGVAKLLHMKALDFLLQTVFNSSLLLLAIIFQPEIRSMRAACARRIRNRKCGERNPLNCICSSTAICTGLPEMRRAAIRNGKTTVWSGTGNGIIVPRSRC